MARLGIESGSILKNPLINQSHSDRQENWERGDKMKGVKRCPKCGSANVNFLVFYRPSTWKCLDCGYEGALIIEDNRIAGKTQEPQQKECNIIDWIAREPRMDNWDGSVDTLIKAFETT